MFSIKMSYVYFILFGFLGACLATCPSTVIERGSTSIQIADFVNRHNICRLRIAQNQETSQPKSTNMLRMIYDSSLTSSAQNVTDTCKMAHVKIQDSRWSHVGQNLFMSMSSVKTSGPNWTQAVEAWYAESKDFQYPNQSNGVTGHYTQVVWAHSWALGCGYTHWRDSNTGMYNKLYCCNYGPAGNYIGEAPYEAGSSGCDNLCNPPM